MLLGRLGIGHARISHPLGIAPVAVLGADTRIIEPGTDAVHVGGLAIGVWKHIGECAARPTERCRVRAELATAAAGFNADELDAGIIDKWIERSGRVRAAADAGGRRHPAASDLLQRLRFDFNDRLENRGPSSETDAARGRCR